MGSEWRKTTLGEVLTLQRGFDLPEADRRAGRFPVIASTGQVGTHYEPMVRGPGVVIGRSGSLGGGQFIRDDFWPLNTTLWVKDFKGNDPRFCYYLLKSLDFSHFNVGSGVPTLNRNHIHPLPVVVPSDQNEQRAIAHILGTLDDKIELNRRMNQTLEEMARAIFKSWFIDFDPVKRNMAKKAGQNHPSPYPSPSGRGKQGEGCVEAFDALFPDEFENSELGEIPKGWKVKVLDDLIALAIGGDWGYEKPSLDQTERTRCIRGTDIPDLQAGNIGRVPVRYVKSSSLEKRRLSDGDLVIEISGGSPTQSTGRPVLIYDQLLQRLDAPLVCSNFCRSVKLRDRTYSEFVYIWLRSLYSADKFLQYENGTTGIKNFAFTLFSSKHKFCLPIEDVIEAFNEQVKLFFVRQQLAGAESDILSALRDTLLPKLISGELRVKDAEKFLKERGL